MMELTVYQCGSRDNETQCYTSNNILCNAWQGVMDLCLSVSVWWLVSSVVVMTGHVPGFVFCDVEFCIHTLVVLDKLQCK